ncbi:MAG: oxygenase MpaB family protein [Alphaproteobacteria bacterium]
MVAMQQSLYADSVLQQKSSIPAIYGNVDFTMEPERFTTDPAKSPSFPKSLAEFEKRALADPERLEIIRNYTMTGDRVADAYAALIPELGFRKLVDMLEEACAKGVENVADAPQELIDFIHHMEDTPDWVDMELVEKGARQERIPMATISPYAIRGAFIATFMNKYSALPMAMTGTLGDKTSAKRVFETASFFTATTMPGALERFGNGFKAAAKVRLMHSMVRFNIMRSNAWDVGTYGIPIPQVDQMPAGLIGVFLMSFKVLAKGRTEFTEEERALVELSRYRCFLLGLPEDLLGQTPQEIADLMMTRHATLRSEFDDKTCGELVRATMQAELSSDKSLSGRINRWMERGFSKFFFIQNFCEGKVEMANGMGVQYTLNDKIATAVTASVVFTRMGFYNLGARIPGVRNVLDNRLTNKLASLLDSYGHADFITDASKYKLDAAE